MSNRSVVKGTAVSEHLRVSDFSCTKFHHVVLTAFLVCILTLPLKEFSGITEITEGTQELLSER